MEIWKTHGDRPLRLTKPCGRTWLSLNLAVVGPTTNLAARWTYDPASQYNALSAVLTIHVREQTANNSGVFRSSGRSLRTPHQKIKSQSHFS